jgi:CBS domain containing-hemolysin-like protein
MNCIQFYPVYNSNYDDIVGVVNLKNIALMTMISTCQI